jgi:hypothetical protein
MILIIKIYGEIKMKILNNIKGLFIKNFKQSGIYTKN